MLFSHCDILYLSDTYVIQNEFLLAVVSYKQFLWTTFWEMALYQSLPEAFYTC